MPNNFQRSTLRETIPVFLVNDIASTMEWYARNLGFTGGAVPETPPHNFGILRKDDVQIFLQQLNGYQKRDHYYEREGGVWSVYIQTSKVRELFNELSEYPDVEILEPVSHQPYGQTEFVIRDPNGYTLVFAEPD